MAHARPLIVVPTHEEAPNIAPLVAGIRQHAPTAEILFVDDRGRDGTVARILEEQARWPGHVHLLERSGKLGLGTAYLAGFGWGLERGYDPLLQMDADLSHDPAALPALLDLAPGTQVVIGSRYIAGGATPNWGPTRRLLSRVANRYARRVLRTPVADLTSGFGAWRAEVLEMLPLSAVQSEGYAFQIELKHRAWKGGYHLTEVPITFVDRRVGRSKLSVRAVLEALFRIPALRFFHHHHHG